MAFTLPPLPYPSNALEPAIDAQTMEIHHDRHHGTYVNNLNNALKGTEWENKSIEEVCKSLDKLPADKKTPVRNNGGGHYNHSLFWELLAPVGKGGQPSGDLKAAIDRDLGGLEKFKETFANAAATRFGSGWAWLVVKDGKLAVGSTANQDNPLMGDAIAGLSGTPILGLDVWEHAYYLKYQNKRPDYIKAFWDVVNWAKVEEKFRQAR